jgi:peptidase C39-like protein
VTFLLLIFLAISIAFVVAGFLLSPKPHVRSQRAASTIQMRRRVVVEPAPIRTRGMVYSERLNVRRFPLEIERYAGTAASIPLKVGRNFGRRQAGRPIQWAIVIIGLISIFVVSYYSLNILLPHPALWSFVTFYGNAPAAPPPSQNTPQFNATQSLVRLSQLDPGQYASGQEYNTWAYSACSAAAMTEVFNAYGHHYRVTDILKAEAQIGEITPQLGLLEDVGIQLTAAQFGFKTTWGHNLSLDQIIDIANQGRPVIVSFPPDRYDGGHILVVIGGNSSTVYLADSSRWNRQSLSRAQFLQWWEGFSAIVTPK